MARSGQRNNPFKATLLGIKDQLRRKPPIGNLAPDVRLDGKSCLVTGATSGLGKATAIALAGRGAGVVLPSRRTDELTLREVKAASGSAAVEMPYLDLADLESIRSFCRAMAEEERRFHVVVLNAGVVASSSRPTAQDFDEMFFVNYLANFVLVNGLLETGVIPHRNSTGSTPGETVRPAPRIVFVSSEEHRMAEPFDWGGFGRYADYGISGSMAGYAASKYLLTAYAAELARRLSPDVAVHSLCPGAVNSNIAREAPRWSQPLLSAVFSLFFRSPEDGCEPVVYLCCEPSLGAETGVYLHLMNRKEIAASAADPETGRRLWTESERLLSPFG